jgi:hypothetical protein
VEQRPSSFISFYAVLVLCFSLVLLEYGSVAKEQNEKSGLVCSGNLQNGKMVNYTCTGQLFLNNNNTNTAEQ